MGNEGREFVDSVLSSEIADVLGRSAEKMRREIDARMLLLDRSKESLLGMQEGLSRFQCERREPGGRSQQGFLTLDANALIVDIDGPCADLLGEPAEKLLNRRFACVVSPDERGFLGGVIDDALTREGKQSGELSLQRVDGSVIDVRFACCRWHDERGVPRLRFALVDVSECKTVALELNRLRADDQMRQVIYADNWLHGIIEQSLAGIYLIQEGRFAYANQGFADIFGFDSPADIVGKLSVGELVAPEERAKVADNIRRRMEGDVPEMRYSFVGLRKDGRRVEVEVHGRRMAYEGKPAVIGVMAGPRRHKLLAQEKQNDQSLVGSPNRPGCTANASGCDFQ